MNRSSTSPFRVTSVAASRAGGGDSAQLLIRSLQQQNNALVQQINILKSKAKKVNQLQDKIQMILRHNTQLLNENQRLAKLINQKKSQTQIWKSKHDSAIANKSTASDIEIRRLLNQIQKLKQESCQIQHNKNLQINEIKNQQNFQLQNLKRANLGNAEKYQLQIRKLKEYCDKKDYEISDLKMKIARIGKQTDFQIGKLRQQKQRLRNDLQFEQAQHRKQLQSLKSKFDYNFHSQLQNLKKQHLNQVQTLDYENSKLKQVINSKNLELEQSLVKQSKMRNHFEDSIQLLKKQNNELKEKLVQNQNMADLELSSLRNKLEGIKESEVALLKDAHTNQIDILNREISKLHKFLDSRNQQIQNAYQQKHQMRQILQGQVLKSKAALQSQITQNRQLLLKHEQALKICDDDLKYKNQQMKSIQDLLKDQLQTLKQQKKTAEDILQNREKQLQSQRKQAGRNLAEFQEQIRLLREQVNVARDQIDRTTRRSSLDSDDQRKTFELKTRQLQNKISSLEDEVKQNQKLIEELKSNIKILDQQISASNEKIQYLQNTQKQLRNQSKQNITTHDTKQKQLTQLLKQQTQTHQKTKQAQLEQLKSLHDNKIRSLKHQIRQLERQVEDKNRLINAIKGKYEELVGGFEAVFAQEAARKGLDVKVPGWVPEAIALKSLFDVFLKNKVLEYCS